MVYRNAVGYSSTVAELTMLTPMLEHINVMNEYTCTTGISVIMQTMPPEPLTIKITTIQERIKTDKFFFNNNLMNNRKIDKVFVLT